MYKQVCMLLNTLFQYIPCSDMYIQQHTCMLMHVDLHICSDNVYSTYTSGKTGMYNFTILWTWNSKSNFFLRLGLNPRSCANHTVAFTTALPAKIYSSYSYSIFILFYLDIVDVRQAQNQLRPPPRHDVASPIINMDIFEAEVELCCKLEAGGTLLPYWETTSDLKGGWLLFNRHRLRASCWAHTG